MANSYNSKDGAPPEPLTPPDCDLRDFKFLPLDVVRLRDSELASNETPEACWAAVLLWCASWHQVPAGSMPDDEMWIATQARYAIRGKIDKAWKSVRSGALRGWIKCNDGRLYHPVVAEKAREAWAGRHRQRHKTECARIKKYNQRHGTKIPFPTLEQFLSPDYADLVAGDVPILSPGTATICPGDVDLETASKGQGEGQGCKNNSYSGGVGSSNVVGAVDNSESPPLSADELGAQLVHLEVQRRKELRISSSGREALLRIACKEVCLPDLREAHARACVRRENAGDEGAVHPAFLEPFIDEVLAERQPGTTALGWDETLEGVQAKASELGLKQGTDEHPIWFRRRVIREDGKQRLIEREVGKAERMNPSEFDRVHRFMYGVAPGQVGI
ncbi:YdaU family protein [Cupriavidus pinatubonensis]|uniref:DUF1376 domain-containing protein n=1 Tax=Cupriavidus pinatubonensis TaxID=248026 RepID=A0ABM8WL69_9BURK|nr:YdaU family protein [Cupriavidus pinatubonensis]CAG9168116.1 hypothetical protein LMG23994_01311 [Cupriavidus pinatubonensis]